MTDDELKAKTASILVEALNLKPKAAMVVLLDSNNNAAVMISGNKLETSFMQNIGTFYVQKVILDGMKERLNTHLGVAHAPG